MRTLTIPLYNCSIVQLFSSSRPDAAVTVGNKIYVIELTVCFDTNTKKSREYKMNRYKKLKDELVVECEVFEVIYIEFTTLGFISKESLNQFSKLLKLLNIYHDRTIIKCMETAIRATYYIFCRRNKSWSNLKLLNFYCYVNSSDTLCVELLKACCSPTFSFSSVIYFTKKSHNV